MNKILTVSMSSDAWKFTLDALLNGIFANLKHLESQDKACFTRSFNCLVALSETYQHILTETGFDEPPIAKTTLETIRNLREEVRQAFKAHTGMDVDDDWSPV